jgi:hypothetical protein
MNTLQSEVYTGLIATGYSVSYAYPQDGVSLPCISFYEALNREHAQADGEEYETEVEYVIDCWGATPEVTATMGAAVHTELAKLRLKRTFSHDLYETETQIHHKSMRYRALIIGDTIYQ